MTALPIISDTTWARMSWRAKRDWLSAANRARAIITSDIQRQLAIEATNAAIARVQRAERAAAAKAERETTEWVLAAAQRIRDEMPDDPDAAAHIRALVTLSDHCRSGRHEMTEQNTGYRPDGRRWCRACTAARYARRNARVAS